MSDVLQLLERVKNSIALGESHFREFKSAVEGPPGNKKARIVTKICADIGEALVAFANADGGELIIGVEDDGAITGILHGPDDIRTLLQAYKTHVHQDCELPIVLANQLQIDGKAIVFFSVAKGTSQVYQLNDGRCVRRKDKSTMPEIIENIVFDRQEIRSREYDREFVDGASVVDLDIPLVQGLANKIFQDYSIEKYLQQMGLAEYSANGLRIRRAALILFAKQISRWHPRSQVRILEIAGTQLLSGEKYNVRREKVAEGNIFDLIYKSWEDLRFFLQSRTEFGSDARFEQRYIYPEQACREALVNAIAHRDYSIQNSTDVFIFDDRMEIKSPGALLSNLSIDDLQQLRGAHESRNSLIARLLRENKYMRELGEGMKRIFELMESSELQLPVISSDRASFSITLAKKSVYSEVQEAWLSVFKQFNLTSLQKRIVVTGMNRRQISQDDIYKAINTNDLVVYQREVSGLRNAGILIEIRTNVSAQSYAKQNNVKKSSVPRFEVQVPTSPKANESSCTVFVRNLPYSITQQEVKSIFEQCGRVSKVVLPDPGQPAGGFRFGFVTYYEIEAVQEALKSLDGSKVQDRQITVWKYIPKAK